MRRAAILLVIATVACAPESVSPTPTPAAATATFAPLPPVTTPAPIACASVPALRTSAATPGPSPTAGSMPSPAPPGTYLFAKDSTTLQLYSRGQLRELKLPKPISLSHAVLSSDGTRVSALLNEAEPNRSTLWSFTAAATSMDLPFSAGAAWVTWSPDARRLGVIPNTELAEQIYLASTDRAASLFAPGGHVIDMRWRNADELSFLTAASRDIPVADATLWSWRPGAAPRELTRFTSVGLMSWRPDGAMLAYWTVGADGLPVVKVREASADVVRGDRTVLTVSDVLKAKETCGWAAKDVQFGFLEWQKDGLLAVGLRGSGQYDYGIAVVHPDLGLQGVVRSPNNCYIPAARWAARTAVLVAFLYGPECGLTGSLNRALLVDKAGVVMRELTIGRKGPLLLSDLGTWAAIPGANELRVVRVNGPQEQYAIPLQSLLGWCCAD